MGRNKKPEKGRREKINQKERVVIKDLPESTRKIIFITTVIILMILVTGLWLYSLKLTLNQTKNGNELQTIKQEVINASQEAQNMFGQAKQNLNNLGQPNTNSDLSQSDIEKIKSKLLDKELESWKEYQNDVYNFNLKYPPDFKLLKPQEQDGKSLIISFAGPDPKKMVKVKKYDLLSDFAQLTGVKKYWQKDDYFLVLFDFINNTTTELMLNTFQITP